ncbi:prothrombin-like, partial [Saccoglossus kowalevskii]
CMPSAETAENMLQAGKAGMVIGWGKTEEEFEGQPNLLREVRLTVRDHNNCGEDHSNTVTNNMFCAGPPPGQEGRDACQGDSGGPYMKK